jgi:hypothetical protein
MLQEVHLTALFFLWLITAESHTKDQAVLLPSVFPSQNEERKNTFGITYFMDPVHCLMFKNDYEKYNTTSAYTKSIFVIAEPISAVWAASLVTKQQ